MMESHAYGCLCCFGPHKSRESRGTGILDDLVSSLLVFPVQLHALESQAGVHATKPIHVG